jgi:hypothetical protein
MGILMIRCPSTGRAVSIGIEIEQQTFDRLPDISSGMVCSLCGQEHRWNKRDAWLADVDTTGGEANGGDEA